MLMCIWYVGFFEFLSLYFYNFFLIMFVNYVGYLICVYIIWVVSFKKKIKGLIKILCFILYIEFCGKLFVFKYYIKIFFRIVVRIIKILLGIFMDF